MLRRFVKDYPLLIFASIASIVFIIVYSIASSCLKGNTVADVFFQLAIGILINSIFFYTQIYLAQKKQKEIADKCIVKRIESIQQGMMDIFFQLGKLYIENYNKDIPLEEQQLLLMLQRTNINDRVHVINPCRYGLDKDAHFTVKEYMINRVEYVEREIDRLCTYYNQYVSPELMNTLDRILYSKLHNNLVRTLLQPPSGVVFNKCKEDIFYKPYYDMIHELDEKKKQFQR